MESKEYVKIEKEDSYYTARLKQIVNKLAECMHIAVDIEDFALIDSFINIIEDLKEDIKLSYEEEKGEGENGKII